MGGVGGVATVEVGVAGQSPQIRRVNGTAPGMTGLRYNYVDIFLHLIYLYIFAAKKM